MTHSFIFDMLQRSKEGKAERLLRSERRKMRMEKLLNSGQTRWNGQATPERMKEIIEQNRQVKEQEVARMIKTGGIALLIILLVAVLLTAWMKRYAG